LSDDTEDLAADVAALGWIVMRVSADGPGPDFAYSIGLTRNFDHPELIIVGLSLDNAHQILNDIGREVRSGRRFHAGETTSEFLNGYDVTFRAVPQYQYPAYLGHGCRFYGAEQFATLQVVYPDRMHRWPWSEGVSAAFREVQPVLADEPIPPWASDE
jgi:hypothetical protein